MRLALFVELAPKVDGSKPGAWPIVIGWASHDAGLLGNDQDLLVPRFKAVELASTEGNWKVAEHLELIAPVGVAATSGEELEDAARDRTLEQNDLQVDREKN